MPADLNTEYTVRRKADPEDVTVISLCLLPHGIGFRPSCQSMPSGLGGDAFGQVKQ